ncbi:hypothetical protein KV205_27740 [Streptomyces sp. SKN60]|uniref:hypothetical protein n=1 Tax=Streptomyces sp. SKN60 TaxID=2855506 RepID=UPI0022456E2A|nr:hypothetical protein [Streptomyces sp. SKN60]MCX2184293.1 hypothetical protein [Streptomyces sp. SKN60]
MNAETYTRLYGPSRVAPGSRSGSTVVALAAGVVWGIVVLVLHWLALLALLLLAGGESTDGLLVRGALAGLPAVAVPAVVACTPAARRLTVPGRFLAAGAVALPIFLGLALWATVSAG